MSAPPTKYLVEIEVEPREAEGEPLRIKTVKVNGVVSEAPDSGDPEERTWVVDSNECSGIEIMESQF